MPSIYRCNTAILIVVERRSTEKLFLKFVLSNRWLWDIAKPYRLRLQTEFSSSYFCNEFSFSFSRERGALRFACSCETRNIFFLKTQCSACAFSLILVSFFPQAIEISDKIIVKTLAIWKAYSKTVQFTI